MQSLNSPVETCCLAWSYPLSKHTSLGSCGLPAEVWCVLVEGGVEVDQQEPQLLLSIRQGLDMSNHFSDTCYREHLCDTEQPSTCTDRASKSAIRQPQIHIQSHTNQDTS